MACDSKYYVGKTVVVEYAIGCGDTLPSESDWLLVDAMTTKSMGSNWDTIDTTNSDSKGSLRESLATFLNFTISGSGFAVAKAANNLTKLYKHFLSPAQTNGQPVAWFRMTYPDLTFTAYMLISDMSRDGSHDEAVTYSLESTATASDFGLIVEDTPSPLPPPSSVTVSPNTGTIDTDAGTLQLSSVVAPTGAAQAVTWTSSDPLIATVSSSGLVTAIADGTVTITATSSVDATKSGAATITVSNQT